MFEKFNFFKRNRGIEIQPIQDSNICKVSIHSNSNIDGDYKFKLSVCANPSCNCRVITFNLLPESETKNNDFIKEAPFSFELSVYKRSIFDKGDTSITAKKFAKSFIKEFNKDNWDVLTKFYIGFKRAITENLDINSVDFPFPYESIEKDFLMVGYYGILPYAKEIIITIDNSKLLLDDQYCVNSSCKCNDTVLTFLSLEEKRKQTDEIRVNYKTRNWTKESNRYKETPLITNLKKTLEEKFPDIYKDFQKRHSLLRFLYKKFKNENSLALKPEQARSQKSVGRNDPCPCGSGKKYKKCCGRQN